MNIPESIKQNQRIILFDGVCNLCSGFMHFVYKFDKRALFKFAWVQDKKGQEILQWLDLPTDDYKTIILVENGEAYYKSLAFLQIVRHLSFPWPILNIGRIIPVRIRDWIYDYIANNRYRLFGKREKCLVPIGELLRRFL